MSVLNDLAKLAGNANTHLAVMIDQYKAARVSLIEAHQEQSLTVRAFAAVSPEDYQIRRGQQLELRAVRALANAAESEDEQENAE